METRLEFGCGSGICAVVGKKVIGALSRILCAMTHKPIDRLKYAGTHDQYSSSLDCFADFTPSEMCFAGKCWLKGGGVVY